MLVRTSIGGGKTHSLIAVHHLAAGAKPGNVDEFINPALVPGGCRSVALVGDALNPVNGTAAPGGARALTPWGSLAAQLGDEAWEAMQLSDQTRTPPCRETLTEVIGTTPTVLMIDEVAAYLRTCSQSGDKEVQRMARQIPGFLKTLFEHAMSNTNLVVVITLGTATAEDAFSEETATVQREIDSVVGRQHGILQPAKHTDIAEIIKRRLFASVDLETATETAAKYRATYDKFAGEGEHLAGATSNPEGYAATIETTYPLHPELVRVLDQRLSNIPTFQHTRGALRLLARTVRLLWDDPEEAPPTLNVGDLPLDDNDLLRQLTIKLGRPEFQQVAGADLVGRDAHAVEVDNKRGSQARHAARAATVTFVHSLGHSNVVGATRGDVLLGAARPGDDPSTIVDALDDTAAVAWHLESTGDRWRFTPEPNEKKILAEETAALLPGGQAGGKVLDEVDDLVLALFRTPSDQTAKAVIKVDVFPSSGLRSVKDEERLHVVVVHPTEVTVSEREALPPPALLVEARDNYNDRRRRNRNGVVFVAADQPLLANMHREVARKLAAKRLAEDETRFSGEGNRRLRERFRSAADQADMSASIAVASCFSHVYWPASDKANGHLAHQQLTSAQKGDVATSGTDRVWDLLVQHDLIVKGPVSTAWLKQKGWVNQQPQISTAEVKSHLWRDHGAKIVPTDTQLTKAIEQGAEAGEWVYYDQHSGAILADEARGLAIPMISDDTYLVQRAFAEAQGYVGRPIDASGHHTIDSSSHEGPSAQEEPQTRLWRSRPWRERLALVATVVALAPAVHAGAQMRAVWNDRSKLMAASESSTAGDPEAMEQYAVLYERWPRSQAITAGYICALADGGFRDQAYANAQRRIYSRRVDINFSADPSCERFLEEVEVSGMLAGEYGEHQQVVYWQTSSEAPQAVVDLLLDEGLSSSFALSAAACLNHTADLRLLAGEQLSIVLWAGLEQPLPEPVTDCLREMDGDYIITPPERGPSTVLPVDAMDRLAPRSVDQP